MNDIDKLLSDTADRFEALVEQDPRLAPELSALLKNNQTPFVHRVLKDVDGAIVTVIVRKESALT